MRSVTRTDDRLEEAGGIIQANFRPVYLCFDSQSRGPGRSAAEKTKIEYAYEMQYLARETFSRFAT